MSRLPQHRAFVPRIARALGTLLLPLLLLFLSVCAGCGETARVRVVDIETGRPVSGAGVIPTYQHAFGYPAPMTHPEGWTDAQGRATLRTNTAIGFRFWGFRVKAPGYRQWLPNQWVYLSEHGDTRGLWSAAGRELILYVRRSPEGPATRHAAAAREHGSAGIPE